MRNRIFTLLVIPSSEDRVRKYRASLSVLWGVCAALGVCLFALAFYAAGYYLNYSREVRVSALRDENVHLKKRFDRLREKLAVMQFKVDALSDADRRMRAWTSLPEPGNEVRRMGVGGGYRGGPAWEGRVSADAAEVLSWTSSTVDRLIREVRFLESSFDSMSTILRQGQNVRLHTPSISPIPVDARFWLSSGFGYRTDPFGGRREFHNGVDMAGSPGTNVLVTAEGVVKSVGRDRHQGHFITVVHGFGFRTLYAHLQSRPSLSKGDTVRRGDVIGRLGNTGRSTGPHLHYSVFRDGRVVDPLAYILD